MGKHPNSLANLKPGGGLAVPGAIPLGDPRHKRCKGVARSTGERCKRVPTRGHDYCPWHGGPYSPEVQARRQGETAATRAAWAAMTDLIRDHGPPPRDLTRHPAYANPPGRAAQRAQQRLALYRAWLEIPHDGGAAWRRATRAFKPRDPEAEAPKSW